MRGKLKLFGPAWLGLVALITPCAASASDAAWCSIRSDTWLPQFPVSGEPAPVDGRRVHIVGNIAGNVTDAMLKSVTLGGTECLGLSSDDDADISELHWCRAHTNPSTGQIWISFHSANASWLASAGSVKVTKADGTTLLDETVALAPSDIGLSYVTTAMGGTKAVIHIHSSASSTNVVTGLMIDGSIPAALPQSGLTIPPNGHAVVVANLTGAHQKKTGDIWTAVLTVSGAGSTETSVSVGYGGRTIPERFPIETWATSTDCPLPGGNNTNAATLESLGVDSVFYSFGSWQSKCTKSYASILNGLTNSNGSWHVFLDGESDTERQLNAALPSATQADVVDAVLIGDEVDNGLDAKHLRSALDKSLKTIQSTPNLATYQGAATSARVGAFSGICDIQGIDAYAAACAPTQLPALKTLPLQYPYFYLRTARDNHMPLPMWGYSQLYNGDHLLASGRKTDEHSSTVNRLGWAYQANGNELVAQIAQVVLSGSKGLMLFQTVESLMVREDTHNIALTIKGIRTISEHLRVGDIGAVKLSSSSTINKQIMVETVLAPLPTDVTKGVLIVAVINTNADGYSNLLCHTDMSKHWIFSKHTIDKLTMDLTSTPQVASATNWREVVGTTISPLTDVSISGTSGSITMKKIALDDKLVARFFMADVNLN